MMNQGFIRVAASTPKIRVADPDYNKEQILELMKEGAKKNAKIMVFPKTPASVRKRTAYSTKNTASGVMRTANICITIWMS